MLHLIYGYGKGKTTASVGLTLRQAGRGGKVLYVQFLKNEPSGEIMLLEKTDNIDVMLSHDAKFSWTANESDMLNMKKASKELFEKAVSIADNYTMVVFDELLNALCGELISEEEILLAIEKIKAETVLTGLKATEGLLALADYASELKAVKHPYEKGILARIGIEY